MKDPERGAPHTSLQSGASEQCAVSESLASNSNFVLQYTKLKEIKANGAFGVRQPHPATTRAHGPYIIYAISNIVLRVSRNQPIGSMKHQSQMEMPMNDVC